MSSDTHQFRMCAPSEVDPDLICPLCHDSWTDPVELEPCGDIACRCCLQTAHDRRTAAAEQQRMPWHCPMCNTPVQSTKTPNRVLVNAALEVVVSCSSCQWRGSREQSSRHVCSSCAPSSSPADEPHDPTQYNTALGQRVSAPSMSCEPAHDSTGRPPRPTSGLAVFEPQQRHEGPGDARSMSGSGSRDGGAAGVPTTSGMTVLSAAPRPPPRFRRAEDTESALLRNFQSIEDDPSAMQAARHVFEARAVTPAPPVPLHFQWSSDNNSSGHHEPATLLPYEQQRVLSRSSQGSHSSGSGRQPQQSAGAGPSPNAPWLQYGLSQMEYDQIVGIFTYFDDGSTGRLTLPQLHRLCTCLNYVRDEGDAALLFAQMDTERAGSLSVHQLCTWLKDHRPDPEALYGLTPFEYNDALMQFRVYDPQCHGVIGWEAFRNMCLQHRYASDDAAALRLFRLCDTQRCGFVTLNEYLRLVQYFAHGGTVAAAGVPPSGQPHGSSSGDPRSRDLGQRSFGSQSPASVSLTSDAMVGTPLPGSQRASATPTGFGPLENSGPISPPLCQGSRGGIKGGRTTHRRQPSSSSTLRPQSYGAHRGVTPRSPTSAQPTYSFSDSSSPRKNNCAVM